MARRVLKISLVGENRSEGSLRLTPLMGRLEDQDGRPTGARMGSHVAIHSIASQL